MKRKAIGLCIPCKQKYNISQPKALLLGILAHTANIPYSLEDCNPRFNGLALWPHRQAGTLSDNPPLRAADRPTHYWNILLKSSTEMFF